MVDWRLVPSRRRVFFGLDTTPCLVHITHDAPVAFRSAARDASAPQNRRHCFANLRHGAGGAHVPPMHEGLTLRADHVVWPWEQRLVHMLEGVWMIGGMFSRLVRRRAFCTGAFLGISAAGFLLTNVQRANAYTTYELQRNLACFTHLTWGDVDFTYEEADGINGARTTEAIMAWQKRRALEQDGVPGPQTEADLMSATRQLQAAIGVTDDGYVGPNTIEAISKFQAGHGLPVSGYAHIPTLQALALDI